MIALTACMIKYRTEKRWNELGFQLYKQEINNFILGRDVSCHYEIDETDINDNEVYGDHQVGRELQECVVCKKEYSSDYCYFKELVEKMKPVLKCEIKDNTCDDCIREILGIGEEDLLDY